MYIHKAHLFSTTWYRGSKRPPVLWHCSSPGVWAGFDHWTTADTIQYKASFGSRSYGLAVSSSFLFQSLVHQVRSLTTLVGSTLLMHGETVKPHGETEVPCGQPLVIPMKFWQQRCEWSCLHLPDQSGSRWNAAKWLHGYRMEQRICSASPVWIPDPLYCEIKFSGYFKPHFIEIICLPETGYQERYLHKQTIIK